MIFKKLKKEINAKQINLKLLSSIIILTPFDHVDFILSTPAISALKTSLSPEGKIIVITSENNVPFAKSCKCIDKILLIKSCNLFEIIKTFLFLMVKSFDIFINMSSNNFKTTLLGFFIKAKIKLAYHRGEELKLFNLVYNLKLHTLDTPQHKILKYLNLVRFIGANTYDFMPKIKLDDESKEYAIEFLKKNNITANDVLIGIHPTLKDEKKRWALNKFHQLCKNLIEKYNAKIIVFSHQDEKSLLDEFLHLIKNQAITVDTYDNLKLAAIVRFCNCFICNETDFIHIFSPFTNLIIIWGDSDIEINKPAGINHEIIKPEDGLPNSVPVSRVLMHIKRFIG